ncbi:MAG: GNAT family N-acetyltransferase [Spirochaetaceae bacterium]|nr:MAG: GNAT family N-acetyltransferase [Spirochaetaceae bacterium]
MINAKSMRFNSFQKIMDTIPFLRIETPRLLMRSLQLQDAQGMYAYRSDPRVTRYQRWRPVKEEEVEAFILKYGNGSIDVVDSWCQLGVYRKTTQELIGDVGMHFLPPDAQQVELGFTISPRHQRQGYAAEAVDALLSYLFGYLNKHRIIASVDPRNTASVALLEKLGMRKEAHHIQSVWTPEGWVDDMIYAVLREEWENTSGKG